MTPQEQAASDILRLGVTPDDLKPLFGPTPPDQIRRRQGPGGKTLDYVDARYVMKRLNEVVGPENWKTTPPVFGPAGQVSIGIAIRVDGEWIDKWDGAGETDIEGEKGAQSDAFKRAGVRWGLGLDLYPDAANHQGAAEPRPSPAAAGRPPSRPAAAPASPRDGGVPYECPVHHRAWKQGTNGRPDYCSGKMPDGSWCQEHP